jgi:vancomycin resistance protein YoaR
LRTKLARFAAGLGIGMVVCLLVVLVLMLQFRSGSTICRGVSVSGIDLSGLTKAQASPIVQAWASKRAFRNVHLTAMDRRWSGTLASLGMRLDWRDAIERAFLVGRKDFSPNSAICALTRCGAGKSIVPQLLVDRGRLERTLRKVSRAVNAPHKDARVCIVDSRLQIVQDSCGLQLDEKAAVGIVSQAVRMGQNLVRLPVVPDPPDVTAQDAAGIDTLLASYTTPFNRGKVGRTHNLTLAARCIDGAVLRPRQVFSVNDAVGPRLAGRGFQMAQVYIKGKLEDGIGGGVCQVSSTLFNAVLLAGLTIKERSPHSQVVPYVSPGRDATVAYGLRDFRFENSDMSPIGVVAYVKGSRLTVQIYGAATEKKEVKLYTNVVKRMVAGSETVVDSSLPEGKTQVVEKGARGLEVVLYRKLKMPDGTDAVQTIRSRYAPQKAVVAVGPSAELPPE